MNDLSSPDFVRALPPPWRRDVPRRIGAFVAWPASNELVGAAGPLRVRPRLMDVLLRLAAEPGVVIARNRLLEEVWPRRMVSDEVLSRTIAELRTVLGDDPRHPTYIETIPTVGYRLVAEVADAGVARDDGRKPGPRNGNGHPGNGNGHAGNAQVTPDVVDAREPSLAAVIPVPESPLPEGTAAASPPAHDDGASTPLAMDASASPAIAPRTSWRRGPLVAGAIAVVLVVAGVAIAWRNGGEHSPSLADRIANATPYLSDPGLEMEPRFAPDGARIAFSSSAEFDSRAHIVVLDVGATDARHVIGADDDGSSYRSPVFVGGHARIAYARCGEKHCRIVQRDVDSGAESVLVGEARAPMPNFDVSADGRWLVYANMHRPQFPPGLALLDLQSGSTRELTLPAANAGDDSLPRFSPDGTRIAFFRSVVGMGELWTMNRDGSDAAAATNARGSVYGAAWRDERHVLVAADWFGFRALNDVDLATHAATFVGARGARFPDVAPSGAIVFENAQFRTDLWAFDPATGTAAKEPSWPSTRFTMKPEYSPDGKRVLFVSNREGAEGLFVASKGAAPQRLKLPDGYRYVNGHWTPDGRFLYVVRLDANPPHALSAVRYDFTTGATEVLPAFGNDIDEIFVDATGRELYFAVLDGQAMRLLRAPVANPSAQEPLPVPLTASYAIDATHLAFTQPQIRGLTLCALPALTCEALPLPIGDEAFGAWTLGAGGIWFLDQSTEPPTLARYDIAGRRISLRAPFPPMAFGRSLAVSPDGSEVLVARGAPTLIDLMVAR